MSKVSLQYELDLKQEPAWVTVTPSPTARNAFHYVQEAGDFLAGPRYYTERQGLPSYLIKYVVGGNGTLIYRGQTYPLLPGRFFWVDCMEHQYYRTTEGAEHWHVLWVHFYGANSAKYYEQFLALNHGSNVGELAPENTVAQSILEILSIYEQGQGTLAQDLHVSALLTHIMAQCAVSRSATIERTHQAPECIRAAQHFLLENYREHITLDQLGERYSLDKYYFQKLFKRHIGITPNDFLILSRLNHAKELLRTTQLSVTEIAQDVGMPNTSHFIKLFQKHESITPGVYRQNWYTP